jgi:amidohydrolase
MEAVTNISPLIALRQCLHQHPEISGQEKNTARTIVGFLSRLSPDMLLENVGGDGIVGTFDSGKKGPCLLFRAELDALPIAEENVMEHVSVNPGTGHKCGHDGHMAIVCGLAQWLSQNKNEFTGKVHVLFQPAEETGEGAMQMLRDDRMKMIMPDFAFALHNLPGYETGTVLFKEGVFTASINSLVIKLSGHTSHAAEPEKGINPGTTIAEIILFAEQLNNHDAANHDFALVTLIHVHIGSPAYGTSAGEGEVHFTLRSFDENKLRRLEIMLVDFANSKAQENGLIMEHHFLQTFYANNNDKEAIDIVKAAAAKVLLPLEKVAQPFKWGEDFGLFTKNYKGCMIGLGAGKDCKPLHHPLYDFPDDLVEKGVSLFVSIVKMARK